MRFCVSFNDGLASLNGATGVNFYSPDTTMANTTVRGNTLIAHTTWPVLAPAPGTVSFGAVLVTSNAVLAMGVGALVNFDVPQQSMNFSGNAYWSAQEVGGWCGVVVWCGVVWCGVVWCGVVFGE